MKENGMNGSNGVETADADDGDLFPFAERADRTLTDLEGVSADRDRLEGAANAMSKQLVETRGELLRVGRSRSFLRGILCELAEELGLAEEDLGGIVRAVRARGGAGLRANKAHDIVVAQGKALGRIGERCGQAEHETTEAAVDRVCAEVDSLRAQLAEAIASKAAVAVLTSNLEGIRAKLRARGGETAREAVDRICTMFEPPEAP